MRSNNLRPRLLEKSRHRRFCVDCMSALVRSRRGDVEARRRRRIMAAKIAFVVVVLALLVVGLYDLDLV